MSEPSLYILKIREFFYEAYYMCNEHLLVNTNIDVELVTQCAKALDLEILSIVCKSMSLLSSAFVLSLHFV